MQELRDLELLLRSSVPIIIVETHEEQRVLDALAKAAVGGYYKPLFRWSVNEGLKRLDIDMATQIHTVKPVELFVEIKESTKGSIFVLLDFHPFLDEPVHVRLLKDVVMMHERVGHTVVLISHEIKIPEELEHYCARVEFSPPDLDALETIILEEAREAEGKSRFSHPNGQSNPGTDAAKPQRFVSARREATHSKRPR